MTARKHDGEANNSGRKVGIIPRCIGDPTFFILVLPAGSTANKNNLGPLA